MQAGIRDWRRHDNGNHGRVEIGKRGCLSRDEGVVDSGNSREETEREEGEDDTNTW